MSECSLGPDQLAERGNEFREIAATSLLGRERSEQRVRLDYRSSAGTEAALQGLIARERECCPFLDFELREGSGVLTLEISAPESGKAVLDLIYEASAPVPA
jgi:hypothetical protein